MTQWLNVAFILENICNQWTSMTFRTDANGTGRGSTKLSCLTIMKVHSFCTRTWSYCHCISFSLHTLLILCSSFWLVSWILFSGCGVHSTYWSLSSRQGEEGTCQRVNHGVFKHSKKHPLAASHQQLSHQQAVSAVNTNPLLQGHSNSKGGKP